MSDTYSDPDNKGDEDHDSNDDLKMVPLAALEDTRGKLHASERQVAALEGERKGREEASKAVKPEAKHLSTADLRTAIDEGRLTETQADEIRDRQIEERVTTKVSETVNATLSQHQSSTQIDAEVDRYLKALPKVDAEGSPERARVQSAFTEITKLGLPDDQRTTLMALRNAFGPIDAVETAGPGKRPAASHDETGGSDEIADGGPTGGWPKAMPTANRLYYDDLIHKGIYTQETAVKEWEKKAA